MENVEDMDCKRRRLDCLEISEVTPPQILRNIFENLPSADCINLSRVNKVWNHETQSVLRDRGSLTAKMNTDGGRCKDLRVFALDLRRMREVRKVVPFSGLTLTVSGAEEQHGDWCNASSTGEMDQVYEDILHQMQWRHLALRLSRGWDRKENCAGFQLVKKILHYYACILEEFSLNIESNPGAFLQHFLQDCNFLRLETLKFQAGYSGADEDLIKLLVAHAPNLEVLYTKGPVNLRANLLEGSSAVHVTDNPYCLPLEFYELPESILGTLRHRQILLTSGIEDFNLETFNRMVRMSLQKSRRTLRSMSLTAAYLVPLMYYGIDLENLRELSVSLYDVDVSQPRSRRLLKLCDFNSIFPKLTSVKIYCYVDDGLYHERERNAFIDMVEQGNVALIEPESRSVNIIQLTLSWCPSDPGACFRFLVEMFPHIEKIVIEARDVPFVRFWDYWLDLEELDIRLRVIPEVVENLDSAFCGIFPEEVAELRERDEDYLLKVNIVPVMPSLFCLKRLKTFTLYFDQGILYNFDPTSMLSKVTGLIAFKRRPDLTVTLATNSDWWKQELQRMEPYASVQLTYKSFG